MEDGEDAAVPAEEVTGAAEDEAAGRLEAAMTWVEAEEVAVEAEAGERLSLAFQFTVPPAVETFVHAHRTTLFSAPEVASTSGAIPSKKTKC